MPPFRFSHGASQAISVSFSALSVSASAFRRRAFSFALTATTRDCLLPRYNRIVCGTDDVLGGEPPFKVELHCVVRTRAAISVLGLIFFRGVYGRKLVYYDCSTAGQSAKYGRRKSCRRFVSGQRERRRKLPVDVRCLSAQLLLGGACDQG